MAAEQIDIAEELRPVAWPMYGVHVGLLIVVVGAVYTAQVQGAVTRMEYAGYAVIGLALVLIGSIRAVDIGWVGSRALLALGAAVALYLAYNPQVMALPGGGMLAGTPVSALEPSLAHLGVIIAGLFLGVQAAVDRRALPGHVPFRGAVVVAVVVLVGLGIITSTALGSIYDLSMTTGPSVLAFRVVAYGLLMVVCLTIPGARGVHRAPHIYLGLALIGAVVRNLVVS
ncbi:MAG: hypothetical protein ACLFU7_03115 [Armatimonadota bacterium]